MKSIAVYAVIALLLVPVYPHFVSPNEFTRWALAAAIVEDGSLEVSRQAALLGPRFEDLAVLDGRTYSNKPPGLALISLPGYAIARTVAGEGSLRATIYFMRLFGSTIPLLLLAVTFIAVARRLEVEAPVEGAVFTLLFATPLFAYGLLLFSHAIVAASLFGAWALLFPLHQGPRTDLAAGALMGIAVVCELPAAVPVVVLLICVVDLRKPIRIGAVMAGGLPFALLLGSYNSAAFGGPLQLSYLYEKLESYRLAAREGIGLPSLHRMMQLLLDPSKGLIVFSPVLLISVARLRVTREHLPLRAFLALAGVPLASILFAASYVNWHGGWTVGPRYILGAVPFLVFPLLMTRMTRAEALLTGYSATAVVLTSVVFPFVPEDFPLPWGTFALPLIAEGLGAPNLLHLARIPMAAVAPLLLVVVAFAFSIERRFAAAAFGGAVLAVALGLGGGALYGRSPLRQLERGYIADVYFGQRGALERAAGGPERTPRSLLRRRDYELMLPPPEWPFTY